MENLQKAVIMGGSVFMFMIAISVAIFSYNRVQEVNDSILTSSENNARTAEYFISTTENVERVANRAEIVMAVLSMEDNNYSPNSIRVSGVDRIFKKTDFNSVEDRNSLERAISYIKEGTYSISYNYDDYKLNNPGEVTVTYTLVSD